ncbi:hypothetical protein M2120_001204 [Aurantimicrobium minutum]|nr:hypothetical protein [Aurantimicrobium minutum]
MNPATPGNGTAPQGTYTLTGFSVTSSNVSGIYPGSISNGIYAFGTQPDYTIVWNGTQPTSWNRQNGFYTNGFAIESGPQGFTTRFIFDTNYQLAEDAFVGHFYSPITPTLSPADTNGLCPGDIAPTATPTPALSTTSVSQPQEALLVHTGFEDTFTLGAIGGIAVLLGIALRRSRPKS